MSTPGFFDLDKMTKMPLVLACAACRIYIYLFYEEKDVILGQEHELHRVVI